MIEQEFGLYKLGIRPLGLYFLVVEVVAVAVAVAVVAIAIAVAVVIVLNSSGSTNSSHLPHSRTHRS